MFFQGLEKKRSDFPAGSGYPSLLDIIIVPTTTCLFIPSQIFIKCWARAEAGRSIALVQGKANGSLDQDGDGGDREDRVCTEDVFQRCN